MKKVTVADILKLEIMKGYRLAAGENGLSNEIHYVSIYDNASSEVDETIQVFDGDIYLSFCYYGKDDDRYVLEFIRMMIRLALPP